MSDGDSTDSFDKQYKNLAGTIEHINSDCQLIISSILPRKIVKLANQVTKQTNQSLKQLCDSESYVFLDKSS